MLNFKLTKHGKRVVESYIRELEAKRKEILDAGKDTADETELPTAEDILSDVSFTGINWDDSDGPCYYNGWAVTDHYDSDLPILLKLGRDLFIEDETPAKVFVYKQYRDDLAYGEELIQVYSNKKAATDQLKEDVKTYFGDRWEEISESVWMEGRDDYVSVDIPDEATLYWVVEECPVSGTQTSAPVNRSMWELVSVTRSELVIVSSFYSTKEEAVQAMIDDIIISTPYDSLEDILAAAEKEECEYSEDSAWAETNQNGTGQWNIIEIPSDF